ncbi:RNA polymerase subunit sigma-70 [Subtercola boreus]|uniref:RNA polymerase subunit sigma-70 n=1 Tax=Subtercola boreus TaxID=120213 RepID=A0A3E0VTZ7_9MICO|nr:RNA polymerase sigma factor [Subtercola boreus]RFA12833.1 RNA polymerase subunit sigma-70 [Subtercola boreus]
MAFGELYDRHHALIHRYAARRVGGHAADDVMSETFLVAFERRDSFASETGDAKPWLFGIATNLLKKYLRLETKAWRGLQAADAARVIEHDAIEIAGIRVDAARAVKKLGSHLNRMPAADRDTLLLYAWTDLDYAGVAAALDVPIGTVRSRLNRARTSLRKITDTGLAHEKEVPDERVDPAPRRA